MAARDRRPSADLNLIVLRVAERADVRLPAIVAFDGFFTSHQKRRVSDLRGRRQCGLAGLRAGDGDSTRPRHPVTIGPYMNDPT
jgi:pyruvate ferredoxin oxidoreductase alpha subunit